MRKPRTYTKGFIRLCISALLSVIEQDNPSLGDAYPSGYQPCKYYGLDNHKSLVGFIIKPEYYDATLEGHTLEYEPLKGAVAASIGTTLTDDDYELLTILSDCHDFGSEAMYANGGDFVEHMLDRLEHYVKEQEVPDQFKEYI